MTEEQIRIVRENIVQTRREHMEKVEFLLHKGFEQAYQVDKSLRHATGPKLDRALAPA